MKIQISRVFNKKLAIIMLVGIAVYVNATNFIHIHAGNNSAAVQGDPVGIDDDIEISTGSKNSALSRINIKSLHWRDSPLRDPFSVLSNKYLSNRYLSSSNSLVPSKKAALLSRSDALGFSPKITALIAGVNSKLVVLNGKIFTEGQRIGGYRIVKINHQGILLDNIHGHSSLTLKMDR